MARRGVCGVVESAKWSAGDVREVNLRLGNGQEIRVHSGYFVKARAKRRRGRGPKCRGAYLCLEVLGFVSRYSRRLLSAVGEAALLRPSLAVAQQMLIRRTIKLNVKTIRRLCRMQYSAFQQANLSCGSGCVESAIRRMSNLRLKAPGSSWTQPMAKCFLFLRAQLLPGRWEIMLKNLTRQRARCLINQTCDDMLPTSCVLLKAA